MNIFPVFILFLLAIDGIQRAFELGWFLLDQVEINKGCSYRGMTKEISNGVDICSLGKKVGCKTVS